MKRVEMREWTLAIVGAVALVAWNVGMACLGQSWWFFGCCVPGVLAALVAAVRS